MNKRFRNDPFDLEAEFLFFWKTIQQHRCDLKKLPSGFADQPWFELTSMAHLLQDAGHRPTTDRLHEALTLVLKMTTPNNGIALQMWCCQVAWLKRLLCECVGLRPPAISLARNPISIETLLKNRS
jgi:hypothetical protein